MRWSERRTAPRLTFKMTFTLPLRSTRALVRRRSSCSLAHFALAPFLRYRRDDTVFVDIQSKIEFLFHLGVFACSSCYKQERSGTLVSRPFVRLCSVQPE